MCILAGSPVGGAAGRYGTDHDGAATAAAAVAGAGIGAVLCKEDPPAPKLAPAPMPKPAPERMPNAECRMPNAETRSRFR